MKTKVIQFYLNNIKPYSDKIPYFRRFAQNIWNIVWKSKLKSKSIWFLIDFEKIHWVNPQKILYGLEKDDFIVLEFKYKEKKLFELGKLKRYIIKFEDKLVYRAFYQHFITGKEWKETELYDKATNRIKKVYFIHGIVQRLETMTKDVKNLMNYIMI